MADELVNGAPAHFLVGLNIYSGAIELNQNVDPPGQETGAILQRTGLNLSNGNVVFGYGGNAGDCPTYSGWVVSVPEGGGTAGYYQAVPIGHDGAVWMGGAAPEVDSAGNIWVSTGNGSSSTPYDYSDSVVELSPGLNPRTQFFAPTTWSLRQLARPGPGLDCARLALERDGAAGRQVVHRVSASTSRHSVASVVPPRSRPAGATPMAGTPSRARSSTCRAAAGWRRSRPVRWACRGRRRAARTSPPITAGGLVWSIGGSRALRAQPGQRPDGANRCRSAIRPTTSPLPSVGDGLLLAPSAEAVHRVLRLRRASGAALAAAGGPAQFVVLAGRGLRRWGLQLRQCAVLRLDGRASRSTLRSSAWRRRRRVTATG